MKTKTILMLIILAIATFSLTAQTEQKKYCNEIYNVNYGDVIRIVNSKNKFNADTVHFYQNNLNDICNCDPRFIGGLPILEKVMKSVFPIEKRKALADTVNRKRIILFLCYDDSTGQILNIKFWLYGVTLSDEESFYDVTIKEIYQLETQLKAQRLKVDDCTCPKNKYGFATFLMPLNRMDEWDSE